MLAKVIKARRAREPIELLESPGVIWPTHINDREDSDFEQRLIEALSKPFSQGEYDKLYGLASQSSDGGTLNTQWNCWARSAIQAMEK
ncbi:hypothetical protein E2562_018644 [Oryza meyeriana var. granulata]|uniref:Uncharacterized protein n=1 Tax=Oryza meyeriana var. granulata TaxID=110450 RepID=A0A6G1BYL3_9ORYZ|nr:hypothetical protein E2562_018644 [Oryza meyeriana var. granulata]